MRRFLTLVLLTVAVSNAAASGTSSGSFGPAGLTFTRPTQPGVWVAAHDGSHARRVTVDGDWGALSSDGRWLTFERGERRKDGSFSNVLFLTDLVAGRTRPLGPLSDPQLDNQPWWPLGNDDGGASTNERWSPAGDQLAVSQPGGFFLIDAASGKRTKLLEIHPHSYIYSFDFTPDGESIVLARVSGTQRESTIRTDLFLLHLSDLKLVQLTHDGHSRSPLVSRTSIAYLKFANAYSSPEVWLMHLDGSGQQRLARCCEHKCYRGCGEVDNGYELVGFSEDGKRLLARLTYSKLPVAISVPSGRRHAFPETYKLGGPTNGPTALDLSRDGRTVLLLDSPFHDAPGASDIYALPFTGGKPRLVVRDAIRARWRR